MEIVIELQGLALDGWFEKLQEKLAVNFDAAVQLYEEKREPGTMGAKRTKRLRAIVTDVAMLAAIVSSVADLYPRDPQPPACEIRISGESGNMEIFVRPQPTKGGQHGSDSSGPRSE